MAVYMVKKKMSSFQISQIVALPLGKQKNTKKKCLSKSEYLSEVLQCETKPEAEIDVVSADVVSIESHWAATRSGITSKAHNGMAWTQLFMVTLLF